jgi:hypothetical protein
MEQCLQQAESAPMGQAFMFAARSKAVSTPSRRAFSSIWAVASHMVKSLTFGCLAAAFSLTDPSGIEPSFVEKFGLIANRYLNNR